MIMHTNTCFIRAVPMVFRPAALWISAHEGPRRTASLLAGVTVARVQRVHLHPSILCKGCIAPILMKNRHESGPWRVRKGAVLGNCSTIFNCLVKRLPPLHLKHFMHPSCQVLGATPSLGRDGHLKFLWHARRMANAAQILATTLNEKDRNQLKLHATH